MQYYRVKASKDQKPIYSKQGKYKGSLIGNELYTGNELVKLVKGTGIDFNKFMADYFYPIEISKKRVYFSFGARFEIKEGWKMGKILKTDNLHYSYGVKDNYNIHIMRISRWIKIETIVITKRSRFWDYADSYTEENGKRFIDVFRFNDRLYCLDQFLRFSHPIFYMENGKKGFLSGYDSENCYNPLEIEIHESGEYVRLYRELKENEYTEEMKEGRV